MVPIDHLGQAVGRDVRIDLGRGDVGVAEQLLHRAQVLGGFQHVAGEGVAQHVRVQVLAQFALHALLSHEALESVQQALVQRLQQLQNFCAFRLGVIFSTSFLFFVSTTLISYILRQTQEKMLRFTYLLQFHIAHNLPYLPLVFTHVIDSLVFVPIMMGIYFFLFEFFSDQLLAFLVLLVVWMGEVFSILSLRSRVSIAYFPRYFACYFSLFHVYFFCYPFGFSYLALLCCALFVLHCMIHLWNSFEVPAYFRGGLSPVHPRQLGRPHSASLASSAHSPSISNNNSNNNPSSSAAASASAHLSSPPRRGIGLGVAGVYLPPPP
eukprot:gene42995-52546_t